MQFTGVTQMRLFSRKLIQCSNKFIVAGKFRVETLTERMLTLSFKISLFWYLFSLYNSSLSKNQWEILHYYFIGS